MASSLLLESSSFWRSSSRGCRPNSLGRQESSWWWTCLCRPISSSGRLEKGRWPWTLRPWTWSGASSVGWKRNSASASPAIASFWHYLSCPHQRIHRQSCLSPHDCRVFRFLEGCPSSINAHVIGRHCLLLAGCDPSSLRTLPCTGNASFLNRFARNGGDARPEWASQFCLSRPDIPRLCDRYYDDTDTSYCGWRCQGWGPSLAARLTLHLGPFAKSSLCRRSAPCNARTGVLGCLSSGHYAHIQTSLDGPCRLSSLRWALPGPSFWTLATLPIAWIWPLGT